MADTQEATSRFTEADAKKGQMMLIYLPEGSVIVDRTNVDVNGALDEEMPRESINRESILREPIQRDSFERDFAPRPERRYHGAEHIYLRRRHRVDWVHVTNVAFASYLALVLLIPVALSGLFGVNLTLAKKPVQALGVERGQLLISHKATLDHLNAGDLVIVTSPYMQIQMVRAISDRTTNGSKTTVVANAGPGTAFSNVITMASTREVRKISHYIPYLGYAGMFFGSFLIQFLGLFAVLIMNVYVYRRKLRSRTKDERLVYIAK